jgi:hypothetical protein
MTHLAHPDRAGLREEPIEEPLLGPGPGGTVVVTYSGDDQTVALVVRAIVMAGVPVAGVEPERNELERIFLEVTKGEVQ